LNNAYKPFRFSIDVLKGFFPLFIVVLFFSGCAINSASAPKRASSPLTHTTANIKDEIGLLEESAEKTMEPQSNAKTLLKLAILYSHHRNPTPNYKAALSKLQEYIEIAPENEQRSDHYYLLSLLRKIQELSIENEASIKECREKRDKLKKSTYHKIKKIKDENKTLKNKQKILIEQITHLTETIKEIENLDTRLEETRRFLH
jgi:hypothetical protein